MACVILPSETARLVYGYLVKENLNDIAHQFLESSPYLMDCCQIVKSGYQFNTKLMSKDLPELLQEYSVIHNLVNTKIGSLCKTSLLYKRIKLRCESLPEILELILFWKFKNSKTEDSSSNSEKTEKTPVGVETNLSCEYSNQSEVKISENNSDSILLNKTNNSNSVEEENILSDNLSTKLSCESCPLNKEVNTDVASVTKNQRSDINLESEKKNRLMSLCKSVLSTGNSESLEKNKTNTISNENCSDSINNGNKDQFTADTRFSESSNILRINESPQCENLVDNVLPTESLVPETEHSRFENPIKIVGIQEENQCENQTLNVFSRPLGEDEGNINLGNSSVVFVSPDVGSVAINQEQSQIIVIPFDYYKTQDSLQPNIGIDSSKELNLIQNDVINQQKNDIIYKEETSKATASSEVSLFSERNKRSDADGNIMTENDFLKNKQLMLNLEKELSSSHHAQILKESKEEVPVQAPSQSVIVVPQPVPARAPRYRTILPKREKCEIHPVVVVQPLLENNKDIANPRFSAPKDVHPEKNKRVIRRKVKKKDVLPKQTGVAEVERSENVNAANPTVEGAASEGKSEKSDARVPSGGETEIERTNEEKENLEKMECTKSETPVFVTKRNSKRLSLSTPRRRSHIRALEFETPPKTNDDKKKSKTSPKVKVETVKLARKSVRNTLFKSPIPDETFKSPAKAKESKKLQLSSKPSEPVEPLNELSIPIATRSPNTKLSEAWENLTGVGCVIGQNDSSKTSPNKKLWDADLRCFILENSFEGEPVEKKRVRKPEKSQRDNRKSTKKKIIPPKRIKPIPVTVSPSKISLTAKRNTYSINGNEEGSPIRALLDDLKIVTPFKDIETIRPTEETPLTKLLRENINTIDIDLSMINTPSFPPTPSIVITPDLDDVSMSGTNYYSPLKDCSKEKILKITDYFRVEPEKVNKKESKEMHEKVIDDLVSKAKEIIGLGKEPQEESTLKRRPSGKILSMVKIQMLTQCDKKLMENIPINEEATFSNALNQTVIGNVIEESVAKTDLKDELEEKRKRALKKIKVVKENLNQTKSRVAKRGKKRRKVGSLSRSDKSKSDVSRRSLEDKLETSDESLRKEANIIHSTPYGKNYCGRLSRTSSEKKVNDKILDDIRQKFPPFKNYVEKYPELNEKSRKKLHYVESFLKLAEIVKFLREQNENQESKLLLKPSLRRFFHVFYKWLKHPHKRELNASPETNAILKEYLSLFDKINMGLSSKGKKLKKELDAAGESGQPPPESTACNPRNKRVLSDDDGRGHKKKEAEKRKEEDAEDGVVSTLPLKKRKSTVQQVENKIAATTEKSHARNNSSENASQTQNFLQDIDVDRFLSQIHGQETRSLSTQTSK